MTAQVRADTQQQSVRHFGPWCGEPHEQRCASASAVDQRSLLLRCADVMPAFLETCARCQRPWDERAGLIGTVATCFDDCAFRCHRCGIAFSNAAQPQQRVLITRSPELNVPVEARAGLDGALAGAATIGNRAKKRKKFCSATSEDAVTWTVVHGLLEAGSAGALAGQPKLGAPQAALLWGYPVAGSAATELAGRLAEISAALGENTRWRSEPDIIALWPQLLTVVEAKYGSGNDLKPGYKGYATYLPAPGLFVADETAIAAEGSYQLTRNWVIGAKLADTLGVAFELVNLGPASIAAQAAKFEALLAQSPQRSFRRRSWHDVLPHGSGPAWLDAYARSRTLHAP